MTNMHCLSVKSGLLPIGLIVLGLAACGGGASSGSGGGGPTNPTSARTATPTRTRTLRPGEATFTATVPPATETATPTETPIPTSTPIIAGGDLVEAIRHAPAGAVILVPPGVYSPFTLQPSDVNGPITLLADRADVRVGATGALVTVNGNGGSAAITLQGVTDVTLDGFTLTGATLAGIRVTDGIRVTIRNSVIRDNARDGISFVRSSSMLIFNNLVIGNRGSGINLVGNDDTRVINNTIYGNTKSGLNVGDSVLPSSNLFVRNNIFNANGEAGLSVHSSTTGFDGDFDLNTDGYSPAELVGANDKSGDPQFNLPGTEDGFHLPPTDDNCDGGSVATDAADPNTDPGLLNELMMLTTQTDQKLDCLGDFCCPIGCNGADIPCTKAGLPDMGFHYISSRALATATRTPRPTRTRGSGTTPTPGISTTPGIKFQGFRCRSPNHSRLLHRPRPSSLLYAVVSCAFFLLA
ncbi:MAG: right-handed parallel beta-helix repeat-containing protein [Deltaproteobacteria bacterium]|nr:right-handed parallel beta-helix repeat-containing protein [Deltaproteobacteria bacterium]